MFKFWSNFKYLCSKWYKWDKPGFYSGAIQIPLRIITPLLTSLVMKKLLDYVSTENSFGFLYSVGIIGAEIIGIAIVKGILKYYDARNDLFQLKITRHFASELIGHSMKIEYNKLEKFENRQLFERSKKLAFDEDMMDGGWAYIRLLGLMTSVIGICIYGLLLTQLKWWMIALVLLSCSIEYFFDYRIIYIGDKADKLLIPDEMKSYYFYKIATSEKAEQDIHVNHAQGWLKNHFQRLAMSYAKTLHQYTIGVSRNQGYQAIITMIRDICIFLALIEMVWTCRMTIGEFVFYFGIISEFSLWVSGIYGHLASLSRISLEVGYYRQFMDIPCRHEMKKENECSDLEFKNVSFSYGKNEPIILKNISFEAHRGDVIGIVGENGCGKTTLLKLICGFYDPTEGSIWINGKESHAYERENSDFCSTVFQDHLVIPDTIYNNVTLGDNDNERFWNTLKSVGMKEKIRIVGDDQVLNNRQEERSINLSGGEMQRLLVARAFYHRRSIMIFDEPTASLDPLAEEKIYQSISEIAKNSIVFLVSHRLTSTSFCNKILFLKEGEISGYGTHEELYQINVNYRDMYKIQSYYYEGVENNGKPII